MKTIYGIFGIIAAISAIVVGILGMTDVMWVAVLLSSMLLFTANMDRVSKLRASLSGIEAETRALIDEARVTIDEMRLIAKIAAKANLSHVMRSGRLGGFTADEREGIFREITTALGNLGVKQDELRELLVEWHYFTRYDYVLGILGNQVPLGDGVIHSEWKAMIDRWPGEPAGPDEIQNWLSANGFLTDERRELVEDYRNYVANGTHRRFEVWKNRQHWPNLRS